MTRAELRKIKVGDRIKFKTWTRDGNHTAIRKVTEISETFGFGVRFWSYNLFWLKPTEIIEIVNK